MGIFRSLAGLIRLEYTSADIAGAFLEMGKRDIPVFHVQMMDEVSARFTVYRKDHRRLNALAARRGEGVKPIHYRGIFWGLRAALHRPVLVVGSLLILWAGLFLPGRILFLSVEGNSEVPQRMILEAAEGCGLRFGVSRREIRSEQVKNSLLEAIPQLKWAGVNTYGCKAVITVRERDDGEAAQERYAVRHIVAARDGVITSCTVTDGYGLCTVGQAVQEGDVLISGYTDCGISIRAGVAQGEIMAATNRQLTVKTPSEHCARSGSGGQTVKYSLIIGKKRINFYKGSGISDASCVKMYSEYVLTLPGGFALPVSLVKETFSGCELYKVQTTDAEILLESFAAAYLQEQMTAGTVIQKAETIGESGGAFYLMGNYACLESIGVEQEEKIGDFNGKTNGTDRER